MRWIDDLISLDCDFVIGSRRSRICLVTLLLCVSVSMRAQGGAGVLSIQVGDRTTPIARVLAGKWISDATCAPGDSPSATLRVSGEIRLAAMRAVMPASQEWLRLAPTIIEVFERRG